VPGSTHFHFSSGGFHVIAKIRRSFIFALVFSFVTTAAFAQQAVSGQVRRSGSLKPVQGATILLEGTSRQTTSDSDGRFALTEVPAGEHHLIIAAPGLMPLRVDVTVGTAAPAPLDILLDTGSTTAKSYRSALMRAISSSRISRPRYSPARS
jgi:hypothetical protein